ncbi:unnamed protein product [Orchesella dallaii]|uniref:Sodium/potassium-transporting ATPase subunit beta-2 n=1 Tax=Orchesella dallaii TaxID=48710 RepID=A0ABP1QFG9_9HEXA
MADEETKTLKTTKSKRSSKTLPQEQDSAPPGPPIVEEGGWKKFVWNEDKREFLGRTGKSWFLIFVFYVIFFISLFAFFMFNWYLVLFLTVSDDKPSKHGDRIGSVLYQDGPGLSIRPIPDRQTNSNTALIWFSVGSYENFRYWKNQLSAWFYNMPKETPPGSGSLPEATKECNPPEVSNGDKSCLVPIERYGACQPLLPDTSINTITDFGYSRGEPCILLKLNRIYDWSPKGECTGDCLKEAPTELKDYMSANSAAIGEAIYIWCQGQYEHDQENLGSIEYFPGPYIRKSYFPFLNQKNYQSPFIMMQLKRPLTGAVIAIECKVYDDRLEIDDDKKLKNIGYTKFQILID